MLRTEKWGRKVRMTIWLKKNRTKYFHRSWNCFRVDESWWKLAQKRQHYFNSAQWSIRNIQFFINSENLSKSGADLGIFVCQSKMTSYFCIDRFHFFFSRGGGPWGCSAAKFSETFLHFEVWHFFTTYLIVLNNYFSPNEIRLSFCILFYFNKVWENINVVVL